jgi:hypothetical protein
MVVLVHPQQKRAVGGFARELKSEDSGREFFPVIQLTDGQTEVAQLCDARHHGFSLSVLFATRFATYQYMTTTDYW